MAKDYRSKPESKKSGEYGLSLVLGGIAVGLIIGILALVLIQRLNQDDVDLKQLTKAPISALGDKPQTSESTVIAPPPSQEKDERPGFSYHAVLPQLELDIRLPTAIEENPNPQIVATEPEQTHELQPEPSTTGNVRYLFQLGAYRSQQQAESVRHSVSQNGLNTRVERAKIKGQTWYRVRLGPTNDMRIANRWKKTLSGMGISPMVIKL